MGEGGLEKNCLNTMCQLILSLIVHVMLSQGIEPGTYTVGERSVVSPHWRAGSLGFLVTVHI